MKRLIPLVFFLIACAGSPPKTGPQDSFAFFLLDTEDMPATLTHGDMESVDKKFGIGTGCYFPFEKRKLLALCWGAIPPNTPIYVSTFYAKGGNIFTGSKDYIYKFTPQNSPITFKRSAAQAGPVYGGAFKFKHFDRGFLKQDDFDIEKCHKCPSEQEVISALIKAGEESDYDWIRENNFLGKLKAMVKK